MTDPVSGVASATSASHLQLVAGGQTPAASPARGSVATPGASSQTPTPAPTPATRIYIDRSASGVYVYQLVNASTGQVLVELPRAESDTLTVLDGYEPGASTRVSA